MEAPLLPATGGSAELGGVGAFRVPCRVDEANPAYSLPAVVTFDPARSVQTPCIIWHPGADARPIERHKEPRHAPSLPAPSAPWPRPRHWPGDRTARDRRAPVG